MKAKIALIIPYFGRLPHWFPYFAKSAGCSPLFDILFFTDAQLHGPLPDNFKVYSCSLAEFSNLASSLLSLPISISFPYKVCEFKPIFGEIFQQHIRDYQFWAFGDIDVVYGDVSAFLEPLLPNYDVISCRQGWVSGSLCVLRNIQAVNSAFRHSADWEKAVLDPEYQLFDEMGGHLYHEVLNGTDLFSLKSNIESFTHVLKALDKKGSLRCSFSDLACEYLPWGETITYNHGALTRSSSGESVMYVHYVVMKRRFFEVPETTRVPDEFYIRNTGIYLDRPDLSVICTRETLRVIRGGMHGALRLLKRYI